MTGNGLVFFERDGSYIIPDGFVFGDERRVKNKQYGLQYVDFYRFDYDFLKRIVGTIYDLCVGGGRCRCTFTVTDIVNHLGCGRKSNGFRGSIFHLYVGSLVDCGAVVVVGCNSRRMRYKPNVGWFMGWKSVVG